MTLDPRWVVPDWPAPGRIHAFVTTRHGGVSEGDYASMNLAMSSGDDPAKVRRNREIVRASLPHEPRFVKQVHGTEVARAGDATAPHADAFVASTPDTVAAVLTADCMPLFLATDGGDRVAAVHAGWRGMAAGVIENAVAAMGDARRVIAWMGPTIGAESFEVGPEVLDAFVATDAGAGVAFVPRATPGKYLADLYVLARRRLARAGVDRVHGGGFCTYREADRFFSYRRAKASGRMGAFIWIAP